MLVNNHLLIHKISVTNIISLIRDIVSYMTLVLFFILLSQHALTAQDNNIQVNWQVLQKLHPQSSANDSKESKTTNKIFTTPPLPFDNFNNTLSTNTPTTISGLNKKYSNLLQPQSPTKTRLQKPLSTTGISLNQQASEKAAIIPDKNIQQQTKRIIGNEDSVVVLRSQSERSNNLAAAALRARISAPKENDTTPKKGNLIITPLPISISKKAVDFFENQRITRITPKPVALAKNNTVSKPSPKLAKKPLKPKQENLLAKSLLSQTTQKPISNTTNDKITLTALPKNNAASLISKPKKIADVAALTSQKSKINLGLKKKIDRNLKENLLQENRNKRQKPPQNNITTTKANNNINNVAIDDNKISIALQTASNNINDDSIKNRLVPIVQRIRNNPNEYIIVESYVSNQQASSISAQKRLSLERALNTRNILKNLGLKTNQVQIKPMGYIAGQQDQDRIDIIIANKS